MITRCSDSNTKSVRVNPNNENGQKLTDHDLEKLTEEKAHEIKKAGITVSREFSEKHQTGRHIYPSDGDALLAEAFEHHLFPHGLTQMGYYWVDIDVREAFTPPPDDLVIILEKSL